MYKKFQNIIHNVSGALSRVFGLLALTFEADETFKWNFHLGNFTLLLFLTVIPHLKRIIISFERWVRQEFFKLQ